MRLQCEDECHCFVRPLPSDSIEKYSEFLLKRNLLIRDTKIIFTEDFIQMIFQEMSQLAVYDSYADLFTFVEK